MQLTVVSATPYEILPFQNFLEDTYQRFNNHIYQHEHLEVEVLVTGPGIANTAFNLGRYLAVKRPSLLLNAGIAGALDPTLQAGEVVHVISEEFADFGAEEADGTFLDIHQLGLIESDAFPYSGGKLKNPDAGAYAFLPAVEGLTVNKVHGTETSIKQLKNRTNARIESMEGAAFFMACLLERVPFLEIRSISNQVEPRNREAWDIPLAINNLNATLIELIKTLSPS